MTSRHKSSHAWIAAIVVPVVIAIIAAIVFLLYALKYRRRKLKHEKPFNQNPPNSTTQSQTLDESKSSIFFQKNDIEKQIPFKGPNDSNLGASIPVLPTSRRHTSTGNTSGANISYPIHSESINYFNTNNATKEIKAEDVLNPSQTQHKPSSSSQLDLATVSGTFIPESQPAFQQESMQRKEIPSRPNSEIHSQTIERSMDEHLYNDTTKPNHSDTDLSISNREAVFNNDEDETFEPTGDNLTRNILYTGTVAAASRINIKPLAVPTSSIQGPSLRSSKHSSRYGSFIEKIIPPTSGRRNSTAGFRYEEMKSPNLTADFYYTSDRMPQSTGMNTITASATSTDDKKHEIKPTRDSISNPLPEIISVNSIKRTQSSSSLKRHSEKFDNTVTEKHHSLFAGHHSHSNNKNSSHLHSPKMGNSLRAVFKHKRGSQNTSSGSPKAGDRPFSASLEPEFNVHNDTSTSDPQQNSDNLQSDCVTKVSSDKEVGLGIDSIEESNSPGNKSDNQPEIHMVASKPPVINIDLPQVSLLPSSIFSETINRNDDEETGFRNSSKSRTRSFSRAQARSRSHSMSRSQTAPPGTRDNSIRSFFAGDSELFQSGNYQSYDQGFGGNDEYGNYQAFEGKYHTNGYNTEHYEDLDKYRKGGSPNTSSTSLPRVIANSNGPPRIHFSFPPHSSVFGDYFDTNQSVSRAPSYDNQRSQSQNNIVRDNGSHPLFIPLSGNGDADSNYSSSYSGNNASFLNEYGHIISRFNTNHSSKRSSNSSSNPVSRKASKNSDSRFANREKNTSNDYIEPVPPLPTNIAELKSGLDLKANLPVRLETVSQKSINASKPSRQSAGSSKSVEGDEKLFYSPIQISSPFPSMQRYLSKPTENNTVIKPTSSAQRSLHLMNDSNNQISNALPPSNISQYKLSSSSSQSQKDESIQTGDANNEPVTPENNRASLYTNTNRAPSIYTTPRLATSSIFDAFKLDGTENVQDSSEKSTFPELPFKDLGNRKSSASMVSVRTSKSFQSYPQSSDTPPPIPPYSVNRSRSSSISNSKSSFHNQNSFGKSSGVFPVAANDSSSNTSTDFHSTIAPDSSDLNKHLIPPVPLLPFISSTEPLNSTKNNSEPRLAEPFRGSLKSKTSSPSLSSKPSDSSTGLHNVKIQDGNRGDISPLLTDEKTHNSLGPHMGYVKSDSNRLPFKRINSTIESQKPFNNHITVGPTLIPAQSIHPIAIPQINTKRFSNTSTSSGSDVSIITGSSHERNQTNSRQTSPKFYNEAFKIQNGSNSKVSSMALAPPQVVNSITPLSSTLSNVSLPSGVGHTYLSANDRGFENFPTNRLLNTASSQYSSSPSIFSTGFESGPMFKSLKTITVRDDESCMHHTDVENSTGNNSSRASNASSLMATAPLSNTALIQPSSGSENLWKGGQPMSQDNTITLERTPSFVKTEPKEYDERENSDTGNNTPVSQGSAYRLDTNKKLALTESIISKMDTPQIVNKLFPETSQSNQAEPDSPALSTTSMVAAVTNAGAVAVAARSSKAKKNNGKSWSSSTNVKSSMTKASNPSNIHNSEGNTLTNLGSSSNIAQTASTQQNLDQYDTINTNYKEQEAEFVESQSENGLQEFKLDPAISPNLSNVKFRKEAIEVANETPVKSERASIFSGDASITQESLADLDITKSSVLNFGSAVEEFPEHTINRSKSFNSVTSSIGSYISSNSKAAQLELQQKIPDARGSNAVNAPSNFSSLSMAYSQGIASPSSSSLFYSVCSVYDNFNTGYPSSTHHPSLPPLPSNISASELAIVTENPSTDISSDKNTHSDGAFGDTIGHSFPYSPLPNQPVSEKPYQDLMHRNSIHSINSARSVVSNSTTNSGQRPGKKAGLAHNYKSTSSLNRGSSDPVIPSLGYNSATENSNPTLNPNASTTFKTQDSGNISDIGNFAPLTSNNNSSNIQPVSAFKNPYKKMSFPNKSANQLQQKTSNSQPLSPSSVSFTSSQPSQSNSSMPDHSRNVYATPDIGALSFYSTKSASTDSGLERSTKQPSSVSMTLHRQPSFGKSISSLASSGAGSYISSESGSSGKKQRKHAFSKEVMKYINATRELPPPPSSTQPSLSSPNSGSSKEIRHSDALTGDYESKSSSTKSLSSSTSSVNSNHLRVLSHTPTRLEAVAEQSDLISPVNLAIPVSRTSSSQSSASIISQYRKLPPGPYGPSKELQQNHQYSASNSMNSLPKQSENTYSTGQIHQPFLLGSNSLARHTSPSDRYANTADIPSHTSNTVYLGSLQPPILKAASSGNLSTHSSISKPASPASTKNQAKNQTSEKLAESVNQSPSSTSTGQNSLLNHETGDLTTSIDSTKRNLGSYKYESSNAGYVQKPSDNTLQPRQQMPRSKSLGSLYEPLEADKALDLTFRFNTANRNSIISQTSNYDEDGNFGYKDSERQPGTIGRSLVLPKASFESADSGITSYGSEDYEEYEEKDFKKVSPRLYQDIAKEELDLVKEKSTDPSYVAPFHSNFSQEALSASKGLYLTPRPVSLPTTPTNSEHNVYAKPPPSALPLQLRSQINHHELFLLHEEEGESEAEAQAAAEAKAREEDEEAKNKMARQNDETVVGRAANRMVGSLQESSGNQQSLSMSSDTESSSSLSLTSSPSNCSTSSSPEMGHEPDEEEEYEDIEEEEGEEASGSEGNWRYYGSNASSENEGYQGRLYNARSLHDLRRSSSKSLDMSVSSKVSVNSDFYSVSQGSLHSHIPSSHHSITAPPIPPLPMQYVNDASTKNENEGQKEVDSYKRLNEASVLSLKKQLSRPGHLGSNITYIVPMSSISSLRSNEKKSNDQEAYSGQRNNTVMLSRGNTNVTSSTVVTTTTSAITESSSSTSGSSSERVGKGRVGVGRFDSSISSSSSGSNSSSNESSGSEALRNIFTVNPQVQRNMVMKAARNSGQQQRSETRLRNYSSAESSVHTSKSSIDSQKQYKVESNRDRRSAVQIYRVKHAYKPQLPDELELFVGDLLMILREFDDGWCFAKLVSIKNADRKNGRDPVVTPATVRGNRIVEGVFPKACVYDSPLRF